MDILTEVSPADAVRVEASEHARLVEIDAIRVVVGVLDDLVRKEMFERADPLAGLTPSFIAPLLLRPSPCRHDPGRAARLWRAADTGRAGDALFLASRSAPVRPV